MARETCIGGCGQRSMKASARPRRGRRVARLAVIQRFVVLVIKSQPRWERCVGRIEERHGAGVGVAVNARYRLRLAGGSQRAVEARPATVIFRFGPGGLHFWRWGPMTDAAVLGNEFGVGGRAREPTHRFVAHFTRRWGACWGGGSGPDEALRLRGRVAFGATGRLTFPNVSQGPVQLPRKVDSITCLEMADRAVGHHSGIDARRGVIHGHWQRLRQGRDPGNGGPSESGEEPSDRDISRRVKDAMAWKQPCAFPAARHMAAAAVRAAHFRVGEAWKRKSCKGIPWRVAFAAGVGDERVSKRYRLPSGMTAQAVCAPEFSFEVGVAHRTGIDVETTGDAQVKPLGNLFCVLVTVIAAHCLEGICRWSVTRIAGDAAIDVDDFAVGVGRPRADGKPRMVGFAHGERQFVVRPFGRTGRAAHQRHTEPTCFNPSRSHQRPEAKPLHFEKTRRPPKLGFTRWACGALRHALHHSRTVMYGLGVMMNPETFEATLVAARHVTARVRELVFERTDGKPLECRSGQWVSVVLPLVDEKGRPLRRSYSLASIPGKPHFELVVTRVDGGPGSSWLHEVPVGTRLEMKGPQGTFFRAPEVVPSLFVATGTGVAPFRGMLHDALQAGHAAPLWVLFGVRTLEDALYREEFEALEKAHPQVRFMLSLSRPSPDWVGRSGYVQTHVLSLWNELCAVGQPHAYVCGVKKMLFEVREVLKKQGGAQRQQLHLESYD